MKTSMTMKDLKKSDGLPTDIDRSKMVVVTITNNWSLRPIISYTRNSGEIDYAFIPLEPKTYKEGIYIINPK